METETTVPAVGSYAPPALVPPPAPRRSAAADLAKVLWPVAITIISGLFSAVKFASDKADAAARMRAANAQLVSTFFPALVSDSGARRAVALRAIGYADSSLATALSLVLLTDRDSAVRSAAVGAVARSITGPGVDSATRRSTWEQAGGKLVDAIFAADASTRIQATRLLIRAYRTDPLLIPAVLAAAERNPRNADGIFNAITVIGSADPALRRAHAAEIAAFAQSARAIGPKVAIRADSLARMVGR